jgi:type III pantothenate kinase
MTLCDIGNTTFAFCQDGKKFKKDIDTKYKKLPKISGKIYFISVNKKASKIFQKRYKKAINLQKFVKFDTKYKGLGTDRQVACKFIKNGIVVDCGSAITVDIIKNNKHKGGFILSGIKNLISFYPKISPKLDFDFNKNIDLNKMPKNTNDAISYAILSSIVLPIKKSQKKYRLKIFFTGEDSKYILRYFKNYKYKKNLIFENMKKIIKKEKVC